MIKVKSKIGSDEVSVLREMMLADPKNIRKRNFCRVLGAVMSIIMAVYTIDCFLNHAFGYSLLGVAFTIIFVWITIGGMSSYQNFIYKKIQNKTDDKLKSEFCEYIFDTDGVNVSSEKGCGLNKWDAFKCWGLFKNYVYLKRNDNRIILVKIIDLSKEDYKRLLSLLSTYLIKETLCVH